MLDKQLIIASFCSILLLGETANSYPQSVTSHPVKRNGLSAKDDLVNSYCTGYTREHWLEITEKIITGALLHFDIETGLPDLAVQDGFLAYEQLRMKTPILLFPYGPAATVGDKWICFEQGLSDPHE